MKGTLSQPFINGFEYGWGNIQLLINNVPMIGITAIDYSENTTFENLYGVGRMPIGRGVGNHEMEGSITVLASEVIALQQAARTQGIVDGDITGLLPFTVVISYIPSEGQGIPILDKLFNVQFAANARGMAQGDTSITVDIPLVLSHIEWGSTQ